MIDTDPTKIKWTRGLIANLVRNRKSYFDKRRIGSGIYRPYCKSFVYYDPQFNEYYKEKLYPTVHHENLAISVTGAGEPKEFSCLMVDTIPNLHLISAGQCFPLYYYEKADGKSKADSGLFIGTAEAEVDVGGYVRKEAITDITLGNFRSHYQDQDITKEDIFYYCFGILHSPEYRSRFSADLKKMLPRLPLAEDFRGFAKAGRELAYLHLNYENIDPYPVEDPSDGDANVNLRVEKMRFGKRSDGKPDKTTIIYNSQVTFSGIPLEAYDYQVNGKSAIEWIMERYQVTTDRDSGIVNDPNSYSDNPRYIIDLLKRIVRVSVETSALVGELPPL